MSESNPTVEEDDPKLRQILDAAADLPADQRAAFLDEACGGDEALRAQVELLLRALDQAEGFLANPTVEGIPTTAAHEPEATQIGPYKLLQKIGEGGMGVVYMADQERPVVRRVAIKIIKLGMDTRQVIARFEAERQALALMDHTNIARVLDAGATDAGRPYFVMELVRGVSITEYCDQNNLTTRQRLDLFLPICRAVQHAHQKGVIHRDLKPSNVLITMHDGVPVPKVIDFGIAKATIGRLTDKTLFTEYHQFVGTPEYMSPEQAEMSGLDIDTRADVYGLGVLLYELLTGTTPFDGKTLRRAAYAEIQRIIREVEPPKPSTRLSTLGDTLTSVAAHRAVEPRKLSALMRGDLDWIVMKCLEKDRTRRYETANAVAMDVQRYLKDEPVEASPPSAIYKLRKIARKHKKEVAALVTIVTLLVLGIIGTSIGMIRSRVLLGRAQAAEKLATEQKNDATKARDQAQRQAARANAVSDFMETMLKSARPSADRRADDVRVVDIVRSAVDSVDRKLINQPEAEAQVRATLGATYRALGSNGDALKQLKRAYDTACANEGEESDQALRIAPDLIDVTAAVGHPREAESLALKCYEIARRRLGEYNELTEQLESAIAMTLREERKFAQAAELYRVLIDRSSRRGKTYADNPGLYHNYGVALFNDHKVKEAESILRQLVELIQQRPDMVEVVDAGRILVAYGQVLGSGGKLADARKVFETAIARQQEQLGPLHPEVRHTLIEYASLLETIGDYREAIEKNREVLEIERKLGREQDDGHAWRRVRVISLQLRCGQQEQATRAMNDLLAQVRIRSGAGTKDWVRAWSTMLLIAGLGPEDNWKSHSLRANVWCALHEHLTENSGTSETEWAVAAVDWDNLRFRLERWDVSNGGTPVALILIAQGTLQDLKNLNELLPGVYRLSLDVSRPHLAAPEHHEAWLLFTDWDVNFFTSDRIAESLDDYNKLLAGKPVEQRRLNTLCIPQDDPGAKTGPRGQADGFALVASTSVDLPAGRYRFSDISDDGMRLFIDGRLVIDSWVGRSATRDDAVLDLATGRHQLQVEFFQWCCELQLWLQLAPAGNAPTTQLPVLGAKRQNKITKWNEPSHIDAALAAEIQRKPYSAQALLNRARFLGEQLRFKDSARVYAESLRLDSSDCQVWYESTEVLLQAGDIQAYRRHCAEMINRFGASTNRNACEITARVCTIVPGAVSDLTTVVHMADRAVAPGDDDSPDALGWRAMAKGMVEYRVGRFATAIEWLQKAALNNERRQATCQFFIAMAEFKLGRLTETEKNFKMASELLDKNGPERDRLWTVMEWIVATHARDEAAALLGHPVPQPTKSN